MTGGGVGSSGGDGGGWSGKAYVAASVRQAVITADSSVGQVIKFDELVGSGFQSPASSTFSVGVYGRTLSPFEFVNFTGHKYVIKYLFLNSTRKNCRTSNEITFDKL